MQAPNKCPMCGAQDEWHLIDTAKKGFNAKHAVIGGLLLGGVGLAAGFSGKRKSLFISAVNAVFLTSMTAILPKKISL